MSRMRMTSIVLALVALTVWCQPSWAQRGRRGGGYLGPAPDSAAKKAADKHLRSLQELRGDLGKINRGDEPAAELTEKLAKDMMDVVNVSVKPDPEMVKSLAANLNTALCHRTEGNSYSSDLASQLSTILNKDPVFIDRIDAAVKRSKAILKTAKAQPEHIDAVEKDLKALAKRSVHATGPSQKAGGRPGGVSR